jgi:hypothetical protein
VVICLLNNFTLYTLYCGGVLYLCIAAVF